MAWQMAVSLAGTVFQTAPTLSASRLYRYLTSVDT